VILTTVPLEVDYEKYELGRNLKSLKRNIEVVKAIASLKRRFDIELEYGYVEFENGEDGEKRLTIYINDFDFDSSETLEEVESRIDRIISNLKKNIERKPRADLLLVA